MHIRWVLWYRVKPWGFMTLATEIAPGGRVESKSPSTARRSNVDTSWLELLTSAGGRRIQLEASSAEVCRRDLRDICGGLGA